MLGYYIRSLWIIRIQMILHCLFIYTVIYVHYSIIKEETISPRLLPVLVYFVYISSTLEITWRELLAADRLIFSSDCLVIGSEMSERTSLWQFYDFQNETSGTNKDRNEFDLPYPQISPFYRAFHDFKTIIHLL